MPKVAFLSSLVGGPLLDFAGERLGRLEDVIVRLDTGDELPPVTGLKARIGGREVFVPAGITELEPEAARSTTTKLNVAQFERRAGEVLGPWRNPGWLNVLASVIVAVLVLLSLILMATTVFPTITSPR